MQVMASVAAIATAVAAPAVLLSLSGVIDNNWSVVLNRADEAVESLADVLEQRVAGERPVTIIAYSTGARMVFKALVLLAKRRKERAEARIAKAKQAKREAYVSGMESTKWPWRVGKKEEKYVPGMEQDGEEQQSGADEEEDEEAKKDALGVLFDVVLVGAPVTAGVSEWTAVRSVVAGRLVNGYSKRDTVLKLMVKLKNQTTSVAGLQAVDAYGVENYDLGDIVKGHGSYRRCMKLITEKIGVVA
jgi:hypothetical protein